MTTPIRMEIPITRSTLDILTRSTPSHLLHSSQSSPTQLAHSSPSTQSTYRYNIKCPLCRAVNSYSNKSIIVYGVENKCMICLTENAQVLFEKCKHVNCCKKCVEEMSRV